VQALGPFETVEFTLQNDSWKKSNNDIVIAGLGWISITGTGECKVSVTVPKGTSVDIRRALLPYEASHSTVSFTGGKLLKKSRKPGSAGKAYGWRA
jgi:hypothetical protein